MSELEKFNVDSDLQSIADAMTIAGLNFCGGLFDHLETGEEFELTIAKKSGVRSMADEIAELREACIGIYDDFAYEEIISMSPSIFEAWNLGMKFKNK